MVYGFFRNGAKIHLASDAKVVYNQNIEKYGEERLGKGMEKREKTVGSNLGSEIQNIVQSAVSKGNYQNLNREISKTVNVAIQQVGQVQSSIQDKPERENEGPKMRVRNGVYSTYEPEEKKGSAVSRNYEHIRKMQSAVPAKRYDTPLVSSRPAGMISGKLATFLGWIGVLGFGLTESILVVLLFMSADTLAMSEDTLTVIGIQLPFLFISIFLLLKGNSIQKRLNRYREYVKYLHGRTFCEIKELSAAVDKDNNFVAKDLRKMIELKMFPQGRLSGKKDYLFLNAESYEQYMQAQNSLEARNRLEAEEQKRLEKEEKGQKQMEEDPYREAMRDAVMDGESYLRQIREANEAIAEEEISKKLVQLEEIIGKIFTELEKSPDKIDEMKRFMDYYLPTTIKLINAYREFNNHKVETDNIRNSKREIENTIVTIIKAFYKLFDSLFDDKAMDIATDISVLNTILTQEGLKESDFETTK